MVAETIMPTAKDPLIPAPIPSSKKALGQAPQKNLSQAYEYLNFYANLIKQTDAYLNSTLNLLDELGLTESTVVVKTSDHGEMALSHDNQVHNTHVFFLLLSLWFLDEERGGCGKDAARWKKAKSSSSFLISVLDRETNEHRVFFSPPSSPPTLFPDPIA